MRTRPPGGGECTPRFPCTWDGSMLGETLPHVSFCGDVRRHNVKRFPSVGDVSPQKGCCQVHPLKRGMSRSTPFEGGCLDAPLLSFKNICLGKSNIEAYGPIIAM